jgi:hypothetical protein
LKNRKKTKTGRIVNSATPEEIRSKLIEYVTAFGEARVLELVSEFSYTRLTVNKYAGQLCKEGLMHVIFGPRRHGGREYIYRMGPVPEVEDHTESNDEPYQPTIRAWPPMRVVDPCALPWEFFRSEVNS